MNDTLFWWELAGTALAFVTMAGNVFLSVRGNPETRSLVEVIREQATKQDQRFKEAQGQVGRLLDQIERLIDKIK